MNMRIKELLVLFFFMWNISLSSKGQQRVHSIGLETEGPGLVEATTSDCAALFTPAVEKPRAALSSLLEL